MKDMTRCSRKRGRVYLGGKHREPDEAEGGTM
jgi:hypothetical protein